MEIIWGGKPLNSQFMNSFNEYATAISKSLWWIISWSCWHV